MIDERNINRLLHESGMVGQWYMVGWYEIY